MVQKELNVKRKFKSPPPNHSRFNVRGRLFVSRSRINQIKKNLKRKKIQRTINKPDRRVKTRPLQGRLIKREFLRKRKRDMSDINDYALEVKCCKCGILVHYSRDVENPDYFWKTGKQGEFRLQDKFYAVDKQCVKCSTRNKRGKKLKSRIYSESNQDKSNCVTRENSFFIKGITSFSNQSNDSEDLGSGSEFSNTSELSDISLKNSQKKTMIQFTKEEKKKIKKKTIKDVKNEKFVCSSLRGTEYFPLFVKEGQKLRFEGDLDTRLNDIRQDEDYDTDEEIIDQHIKKITDNLEKGIQKVTRSKR